MTTYAATILKMHEAQTIDAFTSRVAVPSGWTYIRHHLLTDDTGRYCGTQVTSVFVPDPHAEHVKDAEEAAQAVSRNKARDALKALLPFMDTGDDSNG